MSQLQLVQPVLESYGDPDDYRTMRLQMGPLTIWYSYTTIVAFEISGFDRVTRKNDWSRTTGKHLNLIEERKASRVDRDTFTKLWNLQVVGILTASMYAATQYTESADFIRRIGQRKIG